MCIFQSEQIINLRFWHKKLVFKSYTQLNFVDEKAMWTPVTKLLPNLSKTASMSDNFIFQQDLFIYLFIYHTMK